MTLGDHPDVHAAAKKNGWRILPCTMRYQCYKEGEGNELLVTNDDHLHEAAVQLDRRERRLARKVADELPNPWALGEALWTWREETGGETDGRLKLLVAAMDRELPSPSKIREARQTWGIFGDPKTRMCSQGRRSPRSSSRSSSRCSLVRTSRAVLRSGPP